MTGNCRCFSWTWITSAISMIPWATTSATSSCRRRVTGMETLLCGEHPDLGVGIAIDNVRG